MKYFFDTLIGIMLITILIILYNKTQSVDTEQHNKLISTLQEIKQLDTSWTENVLLSRLSLTNNYDKLVAITNAIEQNRNRWLAFYIYKIYGKSTNTEKKQKNAYLALLREKGELVEKFKGVNAILSNSVRYFPSAIIEFKEITEASNFQMFIESSNQLLAAVLEYSLVSDAEAREQISLIITALETANIDNGDLIDQIDIISNHARSIVRYKQEIDALLVKITALNLNTASQLDALTEIYVRLQDSRLMETEPYRNMLIIFSAILLLWIAYIIYKLRQSYIAVNLANKQLKIANETALTALNAANNKLKNSS